MRIIQIGILILTAATLPAFAQSTFGEINGVVLDSSGASIVGASLTVTNTETNVKRMATTNSTGSYSFPLLLPGSYSIKAEMAGFQAENRAGIELQVQQVARLDFTLTVGAATQTVEVTGGAPLVNTEDASVGTVIGNQSVVDLPLNGRDFLQLVALSANVSSAFSVNGGVNGSSSTRLGGQRSNESFAISGTRREYNNYTLDGLSDTEVNYNAYIFLPSIDALQEFKVQAGIYSAEFGRGVGQVTASTKSGTNEYHGVAFEFLRNDVLDARQFAFTSVVPPKSPLRWNNFGGTIGGPLSIPGVFSGRNRLFFLSNYEGFRELQQIQQIYTTATQSMRNGDFSTLLPTTPILDTATGSSPAARTPFPNNIIPTARLAPISVALLQYYPLPNIPGAVLVNNRANLQNNTTAKNQVSERIDFSQNTKSSWFGRYSWGHDNQVTPGLYLNGNNLNVNVTQAFIGNTRILSPTVVNDARFGYNWFHNQNYYQTTGDPKYDVIDQLGLQLGAGWTPLDYGIPLIGISGQSGFGTGTEGPYDFRDVTFQWNDSISWNHGAHSFKFGVDVRRDRFDTAGNAFARGFYTFSTNATNYGFGDYMLGYLGSDLKSVQENVSQMRATSQAYYAADIWKVRPKLTIDLGIRYEFVPPWGFKNDTESNWSIPYIAYTPAAAATQPHPTLVRVGSGDPYDGTIGVFNPNINVARDGRLGPNLVKSDYTNFAPRIGLAYSLAGKWSLRAGAGIFYAQDIGQAYYDITRNFAGRISPSVNTTTDNVTWNNPYLLNGVNPCNVSAPRVCISSPGPLAAQYDRRTPYIEQWTASIQHELSQSTVVEIVYLGSGGHFLQRFHNLNQPIPGTGSALPRTPWPEIGGIQYVDGDGVSTYESVVGQLRRRLSKGLSVLSSFTWAKGIDDAPEIRAEGGDSGQQNSACINPCERGLSQFSTKYRFVASGIYELPVGKGRTFLNHAGLADAIVGGWRVTSILTVSTGFPLGVSTGINRSGSGSDRPIAVPGQSYALANPTPNEWFNIDAFQENPIGQFGNVGRNTIVGPGVVQWDFSALKNFYLASERRYLQFRFECFNCSNHPNFADPSASLGANQLTSNGMAIHGTGLFGTINSLRAGLFNRQLQLSLKLNF